MRFKEMANKLSEDQIAQALHANRVVALRELSPHGPLGLEHLVEIVNDLRSEAATSGRVQRAIALPVETWEKLDQLARAASRLNAPPLSASSVAAALLEQAVTAQ